MKLSLITATYCRSQLLANFAAPSVLNQTDYEFEWIVINDGAETATRDLIASLKPNFRIAYLEMEHPQNGFGLCHARNLGLLLATGDLIAYLDDDNAIAPTFTADTKAYFQQHPQICCAMVQQRRQRIMIRDGQPVRTGKRFISPDANSSVDDLIQQKALFDSNGFAHRLVGAPQWNPTYRVFADYEYFLQCLALWGRSSFGLHASVLVDYIQTSAGVIGKSNYGEWSAELERIIAQNRDRSLNAIDIEALDQLVQHWQAQQDKDQQVPAFHQTAPSKRRLKS